MMCRAAGERSGSGFSSQSRCGALTASPRGGSVAAATSGHALPCKPKGNMMRKLVTCRSLLGVLAVGAMLFASFPAAAAAAN